jgi:hypothetical protein
MTNQPPFDLKVASKWFAVECNNRVWDLLEKTDRTPAEAIGMVHMAHASCFHWMQVGAPLNQVRALCLIANAHAAAGDGQAAARYAEVVLELAEMHREELADWDWAFLYDATARAQAALGDRAKAIQWREKARQAGAAIQQPEDRQVFEQFFAVWPDDE